MADIRAELAVEISFVLQIIQVNHLGQYNRIETNATLQRYLKQKSLPLRAQL